MLWSKSTKGTVVILIDHALHSDAGNVANEPRSGLVLNVSNDLLALIALRMGCLVERRSGVMGCDTFRARLRLGPSKDQAIRLGPVVRS